MAGMCRQSRQAAVIAGVLLLSSMPLIVYGRYPYLENGILFLSGLMFFVNSRFKMSLFTLLASGILISLCVLSGKVYGFVMFFPAAYVVWRLSNTNRIRNVLIVFISSIVSGLILALLFYGGNLGTAYSYIAEQSTGMYGFPQALTSPVYFLEQILTFGGQSKFFHFSPILLLVILASFSFLIISKRNTGTESENNNQLYFNIVWLLAGFLLLMIFNHRPLRYQLFLLLPICGIIGTVFSDMQNFKIYRSINWKRLLLLFVFIWYCTVQAIFIAYSGDVTAELHHNMIWYALVPAMAISGLVYFLRRKWLDIMKYKSIVPALLLSACVTYQGGWIYDWFKTKTYNLMQAGEDVRQILGPDAVLMGPYAQALSIDNDLKTFIYMFGLKDKEPDLFNKYPLTHVATDENNRDFGRRDFKEMRQAPAIARYWIRDITVEIFRNGTSPPAWGGSRYILTDYERAKAYLNSDFIDSTLYYLNRHLGRNSRSLSGLTLLSDYYLFKSDIDRGLEAIGKLNEYYPEDFTLYFDNGFKNYKLYNLTRHPKYLNNANRLFNEAIRLNPRVEPDVIEAKSQVDAQLIRNKP